MLPLAARRAFSLKSSLLFSHRFESVVNSCAGTVSIVLGDVITLGHQRGFDPGCTRHKPKSIGQASLAKRNAVASGNLPLVTAQASVRRYADR